MTVIDDEKSSRRRRGTCPRDVVKNQVCISHRSHVDLTSIVTSTPVITSPGARRIKLVGPVQTCLVPPSCLIIEARAGNTPEGAPRLLWQWVLASERAKLGQGAKLAFTHQLTIHDLFSRHNHGSACERRGDEITLGRLVLRSRRSTAPPRALALTQILATDAFGWQAPASVAGGHGRHQQQQIQHRRLLSASRAHSR